MYIRVHEERLLHNAAEVYPACLLHHAAGSLPCLFATSCSRQKSALPVCDVVCMYSSISISRPTV